MGGPKPPQQALDLKAFVQLGRGVSRSNVDTRGK
jgi:hypothetical protein